MADQTLDSIIKTGIAQGMSDDDILFLTAEYKKRHATTEPPAFATQGMRKPDTATSMSEHDVNQTGLEYGASGALPEKTPGGLAAASAAGLAIPAAVAFPGAAGTVAKMAAAGLAEHGIEQLPPGWRWPARVAGAPLLLGGKAALLRRLMGAGAAEATGGGATAAAEAVPAATARLRSLATRNVLLPAEAAEEGNLVQQATAAAKKIGMHYAGGGK